VPVMVSDANQYLDECAEAFLLSFSADVKTFLQPIIDKHWFDDLAAKKGKVVS
jgi:hypothetical protein